MIGDQPIGDPGEDAPHPASPASGGRHRLGRVRSLVIGSVIAVIVAALLFVGLGLRSGNGSAGPVVTVGSQAPGFSLPTLTGSAPVDLDALGKDAHRPVILNFFASWCTPCREETPMLAKAAAAEQSTGGRVRFVGVDANDPPTDALPFVQKSGVTYPVGVDETFQVTSGLYGIAGLPETFVIDSDGVVVAHIVGPIDAAQLRYWMKQVGGATT